MAHLSDGGSASGGSSDSTHVGDEPNARRWGWVLGVELEIGASVPVCPSSCACCGEVAARTRVEALGPRQIMVPYCDACHRHAAFADTRRLSAILAGALATAVATGSLVLFPHIPFWVVLVIVLGIAVLVPLGVLTIMAKRPRPGHTSGGKAVWWLTPNRIFLTRKSWAAELAARAELSPRSGRRFAPWSRWLFAPAVGVLIIGGLWFFIGRGSLVIVNLSPRTIVVSADGRELARVLPGPTEARSAGTRVALRSGRHLLEARALDGGVRESVEVSMAPGASYLFAPESDEHCFWIETTEYGRERAVASELVRLDGARHLFRLSADIDTWFGPNPSQPAEDFGTTGGTMRSLRQAPCREAPAEIAP